MDTNDRTEHMAREVSVVFTGQGLLLPSVQKAIEETGSFSEYNLVRSGTQFTLTAELPENVDFNTAVTRIADALGGRASGITGGNSPDAVIR
ncbi:MAG: hypothetical protein IH960_14370, partial [Chloroflexi bacterium]|nr:hypothetical protein [Chloroflexota bacterium]